MSKVLKQIKLDIQKAKKHEFQRMIDTLQNLLNIFEKENIIVDEDIFVKLDKLIMERGNKIVKQMKRLKDNDIEQEMFEQNIYNQYVSDFKYKTHRPIYYECEVEGFLNTNLQVETEAITFKISGSINRW